MRRKSRSNSWIQTRIKSNLIVIGLITSLIGIGGLILGALLGTKLGETIGTHIFEFVAYPRALILILTFLIGIYWINMIFLLLFNPWNYKNERIMFAIILLFFTSGLALGTMAGITVKLTPGIEVLGSVATFTVGVALSIKLWEDQIKNSR